VIIGFFDDGSFELQRVYGSHRILVGESFWIPPAGSKGNGIFSFLLHFVVFYCISIIKDGIYTISMKRSGGLDCLPDQVVVS
jgi:hypothetical protein